MMKKYLISYGISFTIFVVIAMSPIWYLYHAGEYTPIDTVVEKQLQSPGKRIYGTALNPNMYAYKRMLLESSEPDIIALGSSRVMQLRQSMFIDKFINLGGAMNTINEGINILPEIISKKPDMVVIGVDIWWFNEYFQSPTVKYIEQKNINTLPSLRHTIMVFKWLYQGKIIFREILEELKSNMADIGILGQEKDGFGPDGSYYYSRIVTGEENHFDKLFKGTLERIRNGNLRFEYGSSADKLHIDNFSFLVRNLIENDIKVIVFFPPFANIVNMQLKSMEENYRYINDIKIKLHENNIRFYDYTDASVVGSSDCEFIDGFHGGEIAYMRIIKDLARESPHLNSLLNESFINENIRKYEGRVFVPDKDLGNIKEVDFLGLGCRKGRN